jgi:hypothetical protein
VVIGGILLDPYSFYQTASDVRVPAQWSQTTLAMVDVLLVVIGAVFAWRQKPYHALLTLSGEMIFNLALVISQVAQQGVSRFVMGFGAEEYLSIYLGTLVIRVCAIALQGHAILEEVRAQGA